MNNNSSTDLLPDKGSSPLPRNTAGPARPTGADGSGPGKTRNKEGRMPPVPEMTAKSIGVNPSPDGRARAERQAGRPAKHRVSSPLRKGDTKTSGPNGTLKSAAVKGNMHSAKEREGGWSHPSAVAAKPRKAVPEKVPATSPDGRSETGVLWGRRVHGAMPPPARAVPETVPVTGPTMEYREFIPAGTSTGVTSFPLFATEDGAGNEGVATQRMQPPDGLQPTASAPGVYAASGPLSEEDGGNQDVQPQRQSEADESFAFSARVVIDDEDARQRRGRARSAAQQGPFQQTQEPVYQGVAIPDSRGEESQTEPWWKSLGKHRWAVVFLVACAVTIAVVVPIAVSQSRSGSKEGGGTNVPIVTVTASPSSERFFNIKSKLGTLMSSTALALEDTSSPQHRALAWLADEDDRQVNLQDEKGLTQRFSIASFFFATGGAESWIEDCNFLSGGHECSWNVEIPEQGPKGVMCRHDNRTVDVLRVANNNISGVLPQEIGLLTGLEYLELWKNGLSGPIPSTFDRLKNLQDIYLHENYFTGNIPSSLGSQSGLQFLYLHLNEFGGTIPTSLGRLSKLEELLLGFNNLTGPIPEELNNLSKLETLFLSFNSLRGTLPFAAGSLPNLVTLSLRENFLTGSIPDALFSFKKLRTINFWNNALTGTLPLPVGNLTNLETLQVPFNLLSGGIPLSLTSLSQLRILAIYWNEFSGTVPSEIGNMTKLQKLYLSSNEFHGTLPDTIGALTELVDFELEENRFTGRVPQSVAKLESLKTFRLDNNSFIGDLGFICGNRFNLFTADCYGDNPEVTCECCNGCCSDELGRVGPDVIGCFPP